MKAYLDIVDYCLQYGSVSTNRTGMPTVRVPWGATFCHDMSKGFPLITTKKMVLKNIATELEFFIKGYTDKKWLQDRNCHIWDEWANKEAWKPVFEKKKQQEIKKLGHRYMTKEREEELQNQCIDECRDLGPVYGWQWRHWNGEYKFNPNNPADNFKPEKPGLDLLKKSLDEAKKDSSTRRLVISAWNPSFEDEMGLPPCHYSFQVLIQNKKIHLIWNQRSCDMFLGVPYNIASYAMLLLLFAKELDCKPGILRGNLADVHIYKNHLDQVEEQLSRTPKQLPTVEIPDNNWNGLLNWSANDGFILKDYVCHSALKAEVAR